jgi:hypothetical protein
VVARCLGVSVAAFAQDYPKRPVRLVLSFGAPGGAPDIDRARSRPERAKTWGQLVIDPRQARAESSAPRSRAAADSARAS